MSGRLQGRKALITGAATGMGRATAELFGREGAEIILFGLGGEALDDAAKASRGKAVHGDITDNADVARAIDACSGQVDILVNAAGLLIDRSFESNDSTRTMRWIDRMENGIPILLGIGECRVCRIV